MDCRTIRNRKPRPLVRRSPTKRRGTSKTWRLQKGSLKRCGKLSVIEGEYAGGDAHVDTGEWAARDTGRRFLRSAKPAVAVQTITACLRLPLPPFQARSSSSRSGVSMAASAWSGELSRSGDGFSTRSQRLCHDRGSGRSKIRTLNAATKTPLVTQ